MSDTDSTHEDSSSDSSPEDTLPDDDDDKDLEQEEQSEDESIVEPSIEDLEEATDNLEEVADNLENAVEMVAEKELSIVAVPPKKVQRDENLMEVSSSPAFHILDAVSIHAVFYCEVSKQVNKM